MPMSVVRDTFTTTPGQPGGVPQRHRLSREGFLLTSPARRAASFGPSRAPRTGGRRTANGEAADEDRRGVGKRGSRGRHLTSALFLADRERGGWDAQHVPGRALGPPVGPPSHRDAVRPWTTGRNPDNQGARRRLRRRLAREGRVSAKPGRFLRAGSPGSTARARPSIPGLRRSPSHRWAPSPNADTRGRPRASPTPRGTPFSERNEGGRQGKGASDLPRP
jgi:hypothetical protein